MLLEWKKSMRYYKCNKILCLLYYSYCVCASVPLMPMRLFRSQKLQKLLLETLKGPQIISIFLTLFQPLPLRGLWNFAKKGHFEVSIGPFLNFPLASVLNAVSSHTRISSHKHLSLYIFHTKKYISIEIFVLQSCFIQF